MNIIGKKNWFFGLSLLVIIPGLFSLFLFGLNLSVDFTGGSTSTFTKNENVNASDIKKIKEVFFKQKIKLVSSTESTKQIVLKTGVMTQEQLVSMANQVKQKDPELSLGTFEIVGPTIGNETTSNAIKGILLASLLIILYIAWAFRQVPRPASSWRFGICAIAALLHDVLVVVGIFSILGHFWKVEIDSLFVTAILTVIGFSVHDTIVVFDRIRENLRKNMTKTFEAVVNDSILQTLGRSLNTSLTVVLVLFALLLFGGESVKWFVFALLVGVVSGTYSSIFNAAALLVLWQERIKKK